MAKVNAQREAKKDEIVQLQDQVKSAKEELTSVKSTDVNRKPSTPVNHAQRRLRQVASLTDVTKKLFSEVTADSRQQRRVI